VTPWGVPDWQDVRAYSFPADTPDRVWRWEALRRRPDYRAAWNHCAEVFGGVRKNGVCYAFTDNPEDVRRRFGVSVIHDPRRVMPEHYLSFFTRAFAVAAVGDPVVPATLGLVPLGFADFRFDLARPLNPQLENAKKHLLAVQAKMTGGVKNTQRPRRNQWATYLRTIDARDAGASWAEIAEVLGVSKDIARSTHELARRWLFNFPV
jgi:hypothetical protein